MPTPATRKSVAVPSGCCPICMGTGLEICLNPDGSLASLPCFWCMGSGAAEGLPRPCPACGKPGPVISGETVCVNCTVFEPCDPRYDDLDAVLANLPELP